jgi:hypothetical protein
VTVSVTPALITRTRMNLGRARSGANLELATSPCRHYDSGATYSDARVTEFLATPEIEGQNLPPQVPRHRASVRLIAFTRGRLTPACALASRACATTTIRTAWSWRACSSRLFVVERRFGSRGRTFSAENVFDHRYPVQVTPVEQLGTPFTLTSG